MKYCTKCLYPSTKPDLFFNEKGVCSACVAYSQRKHIDWDQRANKWRLLVNEAKSKGDGKDYDCIVPVSGGKDSVYQVLKCLESGLRVLAVTAATDQLSELGRQNLDNIACLGVDHIEVRPNIKVRKKLCKFGLLTVGDVSYPEHVLIFTVPVQEALRRKIPLIVYGENPQNMYGAGPKGSGDLFEMSSRWLQEFGGLNGLRVRDIVDAGVASQKELAMYKYPDLSSTFIDLKQVFLGQYFEWSGIKNAQIAELNGFMPSLFPVESSGFDYENLDNHLTGIHDYMKYLKFGFGRATDMCSTAIREDRMYRSEAIKWVKEWDGSYPSYCLTMPLDESLDYINVSQVEFEECCKEFMNKELFALSDGGLIIPKFEVR